MDQFNRFIRRQYPNAELHMVTDAGPSAPGVTYYTGVERATLARLYQRSWVYVSPSTYEGFGLPYVEAMACGTPVVATPNPGSCELLADGRYGRLVADDQFATATCRLLGDRRERESLGIAGLERAAEYDIAASASKYEALIADLVAQ